jgi:LmeA-like phospholipid-binding
VSQAIAIARRAVGGVLQWAPGWRRGALVAWLIAVGVLGAALLGSLTASPAAGTALRIALARSLGTADIDVIVQSWPPPALWWGNIGMLSVAARSLRMGALDVAAFDATLRQVEVDAGLLYGRRQLAVRSVAGGTARVIVTADNLRRLVAAQPSVKQVVVHISPGAIVLDGTVAVFGAEFPASLLGHLAVRDPAHLDLVIDRVTVLGGLPVPPDVAARVTASINPILDVGRLPFDLRLTGVTIGDGVVTLNAAVGPQAAGWPAR